MRRSAEEDGLPRVLIVGASPVLAGHFAARCLRTADVRLLALRGSATTLRDFVSATAATLGGDAARWGELSCEVVDRARLSDALTGPPADEVWCVALRPHPAVLRAVTAALPGLGATRLVHVGPHGHPALDREAVEGALSAGVAWRVVRVPPVVDPWAVALGETPPGPHHLLDAVHSVLAEVRDRLPDHFRDVPLVVGTGGGGLPVVRAGDVADLAGTTGEGFHAVPVPEPTPLAELWPAVAAGYGVTCTPTGEPTDVDRLLALRLDGLATVPAHGTGPLPRNELRALVDAVREAQDRELRSARDRAARPDRWLRTTTVARGDDDLTVSGAGDDGPTLVVVNALGQGLDLLARLLDRLRERHRVVTWRLLGVEAGDRPRDLDGHLDDLDDVIAHAGGGRVHLVGWCAGAKIATAYQRRHPGSVASAVFLNGAFRQDGRWAELDLGYERNLDLVVRAVADDPGKADRLVGLFGGGGAGAGAAPLDVLSTVLRDEVLRPFRTPEALVRYARQLRELWAVDTASDAPRVDVPVLFIGAERDAVSSPRRAMRAAGLFPRARYAELALAGHYAQHDRPGLVADLIADFVRDPDATPADRGEVRWPVIVPGAG